MKIKNGGRLSDKQVGVLLILPGLAVFIAVILYPFLNAIFMSFTNKSLIYPTSQMVGLKNYQAVFKNPYFVKTLMTTAKFVLFATICPFTLGFLWAIILNKGFRCKLV